MKNAINTLYYTSWSYLVTIQIVFRICIFNLFKGYTSLYKKCTPWHESSPVAKNHNKILVTVRPFC